jgi:hypothetical protein
MQWVGAVSMVTAAILMCGVRHAGGPDFGMNWYCPEMTKRLFQLFLLVLLTLTGLINPAQAAECKTATQKNCTITIKDDRGRKVGTENRENNGKVTIRDERGIKTGTIETKPGKSTCEIIRNSRGIKVGTRGNC